MHETHSLGAKEEREIAVILGGMWRGLQRSICKAPVCPGDVLSTYILSPSPKREEECPLPPSPSVLLLYLFLYFLLTTKSLIISPLLGFKHSNGFHLVYH